MKCRPGIVQQGARPPAAHTPDRAGSAEQIRSRSVQGALRACRLLRDQVARRRDIRDLPDLACAHRAKLLAGTLDYRRRLPGSGTTLMRHALGSTLPGPVPPLPFGMALAPSLGALVLRPRRLQTDPASLLRALIAAVALTAVTARAQAKP